MEKFIYYGFDAENIPFYSCSSVQPEVGTISEFLGYSFIFYGVLAEIIYALVLTIIWRLQRNNVCYKIMFYLGIFDMFAIMVNSILTGYFWLVGASFCTHPNINYVFGSFGLGLWAGACLFCLILVLNRLCDLHDPTIADLLFKGKKIIFWTLLPVIYSLYFILFTSPLLFNSAMTAWFFSPMILKTDEETQMFHNIPHTANNCCVVVVTCLLYAILCYVLGRKFKLDGDSLNRFQKSIMIQSVLICLASLIAALIYCYMQFFETPKWLILIGHICWQAGHGIPAFVYLLLNHTIRENVLVVLYLKSKNRIASATPVQFVV